MTRGEDQECRACGSCVGRREFVVAGLGAALAALLAFNLFFTPGFFDIRVRDGRLYGSLIDILDRAAPLMLVSIGMTLVIATAGIDLSVGAVMAIAGAIAVCLLARPDGSVLAGLDPGGRFALAVAAALLVAALAGAGNGVLIRGLGIQPIVATLVLMVAGHASSAFAAR